MVEFSEEDKAPQRDSDAELVTTFEAGRLQTHLSSCHRPQGIVLWICIQAELALSICPRKLTQHNASTLYEKCFLKHCPMGAKNS